jgi:hypothetical protein
MSKKDRDTSTATGDINPEPPSKRDLVERALSDGTTDPAKIIKWASNYDVTMTVDEVVQLKKELSK